MKKITFFVIIVAIVWVGLFYTGIFPLNNNENLTVVELADKTRRLFSDTIEEYKEKWSTTSFDSSVPEGKKKVFGTMLSSLFSLSKNIFIQKAVQEDGKFGIGGFVYNLSGFPSYLFTITVNTSRSNLKITNLSIEGVPQNILLVDETSKKDLLKLLENLHSVDESNLANFIHPAFLNSEENSNLFKNIILGTRDILKKEICPIYYADNSVEQIKNFIKDFSGDKAYIIECEHKGQNIKITSVYEKNKLMIMGYQVR